MKKRISVALLLITAAIIVAGSNITGAPSMMAEKSSTTSVIDTKPQDDPPGTITGAINPELIPDHVAYNLLFRLLSNRRTDVERGRIRAYIRQMAIGIPCCNQDPSLGTDEADIDALIAAAEEFRRRLGVLDSQANEIRKTEKGNPGDEARVRLKQLQKQKEQIVDEIVASLRMQVSKTGMARIESHIRERVKRRVKFIAPQQ
jgi:hypothetical protein